jgi:hypothetical protein
MQTSPRKLLSLSPAAKPASARHGANAGGPRPQSCSQVLKDDAELESEHGGILDQSGAVGPDDVLEHRLSVEALVDLNAVVKLEHRLIDPGGCARVPRSAICL